MTTPTPGGVWTDPPPVEPYTHGLLSVASVATTAGSWQVGGIEYDSDACAQGGHVLGPCPRPVPAADTTAEVTATPHTGGVTLASQAGADFTVTYALTPQAGGAAVTGTLAPGTTAEEPLPDGTYTFQVQAFGQPAVAAGDVVVPAGTPSTATVTVAGNPDGGTTHDKPLAEGVNHVAADAPFTVYARAECNAVGFTDPEVIARRRMGMVENREVERYASRYLLGAVGGRRPLAATPTPIRRALGALEADAAAYYGGQPVFHAPRWTQPYFSGASLLQTGNGTRPVLRTHLDTAVAFGGGYYANPYDPGQALPAGQFWLLATGQVRAWRTEVFVNETFTTSTNLRAALAERTYLLDLDCYRAAVLVDLSGED